jgi:hypothetical protein
LCAEVQVCFGGKETLLGSTSLDALNLLINQQYYQGNERFVAPFKEFSFSLNPLNTYECAVNETLRKWWMIV